MVTYRVSLLLFFLWFLFIIALYYGNYITESNHVLALGLLLGDLI